LFAVFGRWLPAIANDPHPQRTTPWNDDSESQLI